MYIQEASEGMEYATVPTQPLLPRFRQRRSSFTSFKPKLKSGSAVSQSSIPSTSNQSTTTNSIMQEHNSDAEGQHDQEVEEDLSSNAQGQDGNDGGEGLSADAQAISNMTDVASIMIYVDAVKGRLDTVLEETEV